MGDVRYVVSGCRSADLFPVKGRNAALMLAIPNILKNNSSLKNANKLSKRSKELYFDSGGRQIYEITNNKSKRYKRFTSERNKPVYFGDTLNIHVSHLEQAVKMFRPKYLLGLDFPIRSSSDPQEQNRRFHKTLNINYSWAKSTIAIRDKHFPYLKVILPLQTQNIQNLLQYWNQIKHLKPDGVALPMRCFKNDNRLIEVLLEIHKLKIKEVHLLGSSRIGTIIISSFLARNNYFQNITLDSGTWRQAADRGKVIIPYDLREVHIGDKNCIITERTSKLPKEWTLKLMQVIDAAGGSNEHKKLREFNFAAIQTTIKDIQKNADTPLKIKTYLSERSTRTEDIEKICHLLNRIPT